jgi:tetratricopeptide (TPR) repeat protein
MDTLRPPLTSGGAPPPPSAFEAQPSEPEPESVPVVYDDTGWPPVAADAFPDMPSSLPPPTQPVRRAISGTDDDFAGTGDGHPFSNEDSYPGPRRRHVGGWVVSLVLIMALGVVGWAVAKPYLAAREAREANATTAQLDPRAQSFLSQGEQAMADGSLDVAQEAFDKASALADRDARVLLDEARVVAAKADIPWLKLRLLPPDATDEIRTTRSQYDDLIVRVRRTADDALAAMPDDIAAVRSKIDALRLEGDRDTARASVSRLSGQASQPETAYVLAALDLDEAAPLWTTLLERLRVAAAAEGNAGRAQAALVYALAKSGDGVGAKAELLKIDARARPYPLLPALHAYVDKLSSPAAEAPSASSPPRFEPSPPKPFAKPPAPRAAPAFVAAAAPYDNGDSADPRIAMQAAAQALKRADFARARQIYQGIVDRNPSDSEAIAGLGDVARLRGDTTEAIASYQRAIAVNPSFLPALLGLADTEWANGDRAGAARTYAGVIDHFPEGTYPAYVSQRSALATAPASEPNALPESAGTTAAPSTAPDERTE